MEGGFFLEMADPISFKFEGAKAGRGADGGEGNQPFVFLMKFQQFIQINVADAVAIGHHESLLIDYGRQSLEAAAGQGGLARIDEMDFPGITMILVDAPDRAIIDRNGKILVQTIKIKEISLDLLSLVTQGQDEFVEPILGIVLHDMPKNGPAANFHQRLGADLRLFCQARPHTAAEDDHWMFPFHPSPPDLNEIPFLQRPAISQ